MAPTPMAALRPKTVDSAPTMNGKKAATPRPKLLAKPTPAPRTRLGNNSLKKTPLPERAGRRHAQR